MPRDRFISDDLYNMRDRLKKNHVAHQPAATPEEVLSTEINTIPREDPSPVISTEEKTAVREAAAVPSPAPPPASAPVAPAAGRLPQIAGFSNDGEAGRDRRDLEGRLLRDLSVIEVEEENSLQRTNALKKFRSVVEKQLNELQELDKNNSDQTIFRASIDRLRIEYFQAFGRFDAELSRRGNSASAPETISAPRQPVWQIAAAIIAAAVIMSLTMLVIFGG